MKIILELEPGERSMYPWPWPVTVRDRFLVGHGMLNEIRVEHSEMTAPMNGPPQVTLEFVLIDVPMAQSEPSEQKQAESLPRRKLLMLEA